jgi:hypothetical protein
LAVAKNHFPAVRFVAGWIRRPQLFGQVFDELLHIVKTNADAESVLPDLRTDIAARIDFYCFVPTFYFSNGLEYDAISPELLATIRSLVDDFPGEMDSCLGALYRDRARL